MLALTLAGCAGYSYTLNERTVYEGPRLFADFAIADDKLRECVEQAVLDDAITSAEDLEDLNCSQAGIKELAGIEVFTGLKRLGLDGNAISDLTPLLGLAKLELLHLRNNRLASLDPRLCGATAKKIALAGNENLACADVHALRACGATVLDEPLHCGKPAP